MRAPSDIGIAARFIVETCAFWAVHRHWDVQRQNLSEEYARDAVIDLVAAALTKPMEQKAPTGNRARRK